MNIQQPQQVEVPPKSPIIDFVAPEYIHLELGPYPGTIPELVADLQIVLLEEFPLYIEGS